MPGSLLDSKGVKYLFTRQCRVHDFRDAGFTLNQFYAVEQLINILIVAGGILQTLLHEL